MNFKLNAFIVAALLSAAGSANAAISDSLSGNGEAFLVVNDDISGFSFVGDLGIAMDSFNSTAPQTFNLNNFSQWGAFMTAIGGNLNHTGPNGERVTFAVLATDSTGSTAGSDRMLFTTAGTVTEDDIEFTKSNGFGGATTQMDYWLSLLNSNSDVVGGDMNTVANGSAYSAAGSTTYFDTAIGGYIKNKLAHSTYVNANEAGNFGLNKTGGSQSTLAPTIYTEYAGDFAIDATTNTLVYAPIPEAETYAMMLAGLGLVGFMVRRRNFR